MTKKSFVISLLMTAITVCLAFVSCKKDDVNKSDSIVGKWKMTGYIHNGADVYGTAVLPCVTDDIITFSITNIVSLDEGLTKCSPKDPQTSSGTYSINSTQTQITITYDGSTDTDDILTLNSTTLIIRQLSNDDVITYTRQP